MYSLISFFFQMGDDLSVKEIFSQRSAEANQSERKILKLFSASIGGYNHCLDRIGICKKIVYTADKGMIKYFDCSKVLTVSL